jgi:hypothetical protein
MSDLVSFYDEYGPSRFRKKNGSSPKRRALQILAREYDLPLIRIGHAVLIDPQAGDDRLRELAHRPAVKGPRPPGRPRKQRPEEART